MELKRIIFDVGEGEKELFFSDGNVPYDAEKARFLHKLVKFVFLDGESFPAYAEIYFTLRDEPYCAARKEGEESYWFLACVKKNRLIRLAENEEVIDKLTELSGYNFRRAVNAFVIDKEGFEDFLKNPSAAFEALKLEDNLEELSKAAGKRVTADKVYKAEKKAKAIAKEFVEAEKSREKAIASHNTDAIKRAKEIEEIDRRLNQIESDGKVVSALEKVRLLDLRNETVHNEDELPRLESRLKYAVRAHSRAQEYEIKINKVLRYIELEPVRREMYIKREPYAKKLVELAERLEELRRSLEEGETRTETKVTMVNKTVRSERVDTEKQSRIYLEIGEINAEIEKLMQEEKRLQAENSEPHVDSPDVVAMLKRLYTQGYSPADAREAAYKRLNLISPREAEKANNADIGILKEKLAAQLKKVEELRHGLNNCVIIEEKLVEEPFFTRVTEKTNGLTADERIKINAEAKSLELELSSCADAVARFDAEINTLDLDDLISGDKIELYNMPREELNRLKEDNDNSLKDNMRRKRKAVKEIREINLALPEQRKILEENSADLTAMDDKKEEEYRSCVRLANEEIQKLNDKRARLNSYDEAEFQASLDKQASRIVKLESERDKALSDAQALKDALEERSDAGKKLKMNDYAEILRKTERADGILRVMTNYRYGLMIDDSLYLVNENDDEIKPDSLSETDKLYLYVALLSVDNPFDFFVLDDALTPDRTVKENIVNHAKCALPVFKNL